MRQRPYADTWKTEEYGRDQLNGIWRHNEVKNTGSCLRMLGSQAFANFGHLPTERPIIKNDQL